MIGTFSARASDGCEIVARSTGTGDNALFFVHGVGSTAAIWDRQLEAFASSHRCFAVELRGNGAGPDPHLQSITRERFAADVLAIADAARIRRFDFVGCSLGGAVAFELWKTAPKRLASLTLVGSYAAYPNGRAYAARVIAAAEAAGSMARFARERSAMLGLRPEREAETVEQMAAKSPGAYRASTLATWTGDYRPLLPSITIPVLVVCGERDTIAPPALSHEIAHAIPCARLEIVPGAGHVANADAPEIFDALLSSFLTEGQK